MVRARERPVRAGVHPLARASPDADRARHPRKWTQTLIRMQADATLPPERRRNYRNIVHALRTVVKTDGVAGLFRGATSTSATAMALNCGMLASNEHAKQELDRSGLAARGTVASSVAAAAVGGFAASLASLPFDFVKTQMQKQQPLPDGRMPFAGVLDCAAQSLRARGAGVFFTGWRVWFYRIGSHAVLSLLFLDALMSVQSTRR